MTEPVSGKSRIKRVLGDEKGAQLLEFAFILPILLSLLFGIITGGVAFSHNLSIDNAARETARYGATLPVDGDLPGWLNQLADVAISSATGTLDDGQDGREVCVAYVFPNGTHAHDQTRSLTEDAAGNRTVSSTACLNDGRPGSERRVQVVVQRDTDLIVFYFSKTVNLEGQSVARFERAQT